MPRVFPLKIALFIGNSHPSGSVRKLLHCLVKQKIPVAQVYAYDISTLWKARYFAGIELLPHYLKGSQKAIATRLKSNYAKAYAVWLKQFTDQKFDLGLSFFGYWLPPSLFNTPRLGFINFHPGKLPDLPGFEPETLAILQRWPRLGGTIHQVSERFDQGPILAYTPEVVIRRRELPHTLLKRVTFAGCAALPGLLLKIAEQGLVPLPINFDYKELPNCNIFQKISLLTDDCESICLKNRAFNRQEINRYLTIDLKGLRYHVMDAKVIPQWRAWLLFGQDAVLVKAGEEIAEYQKLKKMQGWKCYRLCDGFVALHLHRLGEMPANVSEVTTTIEGSALKSREVFEKS